MERLKGRSHQARALEWGAILLFILVLSWVLLTRYEGLKEEALATMAHYEHQVLQTRLQMYRIRHGDWPSNLQALLEESSDQVVLENNNAR